MPSRVPQFLATERHFYLGEDLDGHNAIGGFCGPIRWWEVERQWPMSTLELDSLVAPVTGVKELQFAHTQLDFFATCILTCTTGRFTVENGYIAI